MTQSELLFAISLMNARYAHAIDTERFEDWPEFFTDKCLYNITSHENHARGLETGIVYCDSKGMLKDRVAGLRQANIYEAQRYRHLVMMPVRAEVDGDIVRAETPFAVYRIMHDGRTSLFITGCYLDELVPLAAGDFQIQKRTVICDSSVFDTLLAIPL
jgi:3-phenylpropionate/cinnamic acid dioxygenase small subunit